MHTSPTAKAVGDEYVFRAAPLRNVALRAPYFHSGQVWSVKQAVALKSEIQLGAKLSDKEEIVAFLHSLTGRVPGSSVLPMPTNTRPKPAIDR
ncbi:cytochrome c peroxidase [Bradyrhizobium sp. i1.4.4]